MRILLFSWRDIKHPLSGGAEVLTYQIAKRWVRQGHIVSLVSARFTGALETEVISGVTIYRPAEFFARSPREYLSFLYQTAKFYRRELAGNYDVIIDQVHGLPFFTPLYAKEKLILFPLEVARNIWFYEFPFTVALIGSLLELLYIKLFSRLPFMTISTSTASELKKLGVKQVFTITPGLNFKPLAKIPPKSRFPLLVSLGRLTKMKRVSDTLQAFRLLHKSFPLIKLVIIGRGKKEYSAGLKKLCRDMAIDDRVSFVGYISEKKKRAFLQKAWVLVSSSLKEGWGLNVIEAAACGTPAVAYKVPGLVDSIKNRQTGLLCNKNNEVHLAKNIRKLLINPRLRRQYAKNALVYSHNFDWDKTANQELEILEKIIRP